MLPSTRRTVLRWVLRGLAALGVVSLPFFLLVRGALLAWAGFGWPAWLAVAFGGLLSGAAVSAASYCALRRLDAPLRFRRLALRAVLPVVALYCASSLLYLSGANAKSPEIRAAYLRLHPVLRLAVGTLRLVDGRIVLTDIERGPASYAEMRLPRPPSSAHYRQQDGTVHAIDLRTAGRGLVRNGLVRLYFEVLGFDTLRHVGTADHLHVRLPG